MTGRGVFIGVAVETYERHPRLPWSRIDLLEMDDLFGELGFPQRILLGDKKASPTAGELTDLLRSSIRERPYPDEPLVLYWAGHGVVEDGVHYLLGSDSPADALSAANAVAAAALAELLVGAKVERALILLDVCNAGAGAMDLAAAINEGLRSKAAEGAGESGIVVIAVSRPTESAVDGALATVFKDSVLTDERTGTFRDKFVRLGGLFDLLNESLCGGRTARPVSANVVDWTAPLNLLPNPRWGRGGPVWNETDGVYFDRQARGASGDADWGSYFARRERVLRRIAEWLAPDRPGGGLLAVYGPPGCGKSAVVARAVTLSRPDRREAARASPGWGPGDEWGMPPEGSIGAALHATGKTLDRVVDELSGLLGIEHPERPDQTGDLILTRRRALIEELHAMAWWGPVTVAVDGLDEAAPGQALALAEFLADVAADDRLRVLVGTRPGGRRGLDDENSEDLLSALGVEPGDDIDLSDPKWESHQALEAYLTKRLLAIWQESTLEDFGDFVAAVAETMAHRLAGQFHVARLVVGPNSVLARRGPPADLSKLEFPTEIGQAIGQDLERFSDSSLVELLRTLAWAEGDGFSQPVWLVVAGALSPMSRPEEDAVERAISAAGDYLVPSTEDEAGRRRWRLHHSTYAEYFRRLTLEDEGADERAVEKRIVERLRPPSWEGADPYVLTNLATHAENAGVLGELVRDPDYLVYAEPSVLLASLASLAPDDEAQPMVRRYGRTAHHLAGASSGERAAYLELAAFEDHDPAGRPSPHADQPWSFRWGWLTGVRPHRVIPALGGARSVSLHELEGRTVAVTSGERLRVIDVVTGRRLFDAQGGGFAALVETTDGPHTLSLASALESLLDDRGQVDTTSVVFRRWLRRVSLATREEAALLGGARGDLIGTGARPFAVGGNRWLAVALSDGGVWVQDCLSEDQWTPDSLQDLMVSCLFVLPGEEDCVVLAGSEAGELAAWSVASGTEARVKAHETPVRALAGAVTSGDRVVISSDRDRLHVWRLTEDHALEGPLCSTDVGFEAIACADVAGQLFVATLAGRAVGRRLYAGRRPARAGQCELWRVDDERQSIEMTTSLEVGEIDDVAFGGSGPGAPYLVAAVDSGAALYCWEGVELAGGVERVPLQRALRLIAPERVGESTTDALVALWEGNWLTMFDGANGKWRPGFPLPVDVDGTNARAVGALELESGETVIVLGYESGLVLAWSAPDGDYAGTQNGDRPIWAIAVIASPGGPKQLLALDEDSDLYHFAWQKRLDDGVYYPPDVANSLYTGRLASVRISLASGEPVVKERRDFPRVVNGVSASRLRGSPVFVISGDAGCVFVDPMHPEGKADVGFDFPVHDATLTEGWLAVRSDRQVLLFHVGDDPSRASGPGLDLPPAEGAPVLGYSPGGAPFWQESWAAPVSAMSLRHTAKGLRLAVGSFDGAVHVHTINAGGVTRVFSLDLDSPVTGVLSAMDGATLISSWRGLLCVE